MPIFNPRQGFYHSMRIHSFYLSYLLLISSTILSVDTFSQMYRVNTEHEDQNRHYLVYLPKSFTNQSAINLVIGFHGYGGTASGLELEVTGNFNQFAEKYNFIAVYPQSTYFFNEDRYISTFNETVGSNSEDSDTEICTLEADHYPKFPSCKNPSRCSYQPCVDDLGFIKNIIKEIQAEYKIKNIYVFGNSTGGSFAQRFACMNPDLIEGILNVSGMQTLGYGCVPDTPVNLLLYGAANDQAISPVKEISPDGYLYETIDRITHRWAKKFHCSSTHENIIKNNETFVEKIFSSCDGEITIKSILNLEGAHLWPERGFDEVTGESSWIAYGYCATKLQPELNNDLCRDNLRRDSWGTDYLVKNLLNIN